MALLGGQSDNRVLYPLQNFNMMRAQSTIRYNNASRFSQLLFVAFKLLNLHPRY